SKSDVPSTSSIILQFLPSGLCLPLALERPVVLGRIAVYEDQGDEDHIDLSDLNALRHGISRRHCLLRRLDNLILVRDLESTNGTVLNQELLIAHEDYPIVHGDRLILGTLNIVIAFSTRPGA
ncbi:MAG: FHA domain-containing protein, partial [Anaerolineae bacterium]|nr:FHA domain-containing protein [Anaerolineae bacterium]